MEGDGRENGKEVQLFELLELWNVRRPDRSASHAIVHQHNGAATGAGWGRGGLNQGLIGAIRNQVTWLLRSKYTKMKVWRTSRGSKHLCILFHLHFSRPKLCPKRGSSCSSSNSEVRPPLHDLLSSSSPPPSPALSGILLKKNPPSSANCVLYSKIFSVT